MVPYQSDSEEVVRLKAALEMAEQARLSGAPTYTLAESRKLLERIFAPTLQTNPNLPI